MESESRSNETRRMRCNQSKKDVHTLNIFVFCSVLTSRTRQPNNNESSDTGCLRRRGELGFKKCSRNAKNQQFIFVSAPLNPVSLPEWEVNGLR